MQQVLRPGQTTQEFLWPSPRDSPRLALFKLIVLNQLEFEAKRSKQISSLAKQLGLKQPDSELAIFRELLDEKAEYNDVSCALIFQPNFLQNLSRLRYDALEFDWFCIQNTRRKNVKGQQLHYFRLKDIDVLQTASGQENKQWAFQYFYAGIKEGRFQPFDYDWAQSSLKSSRVLQAAVMRCVDALQQCSEQQEVLTNSKSSDWVRSRGVRGRSYKDVRRVTKISTTPDKFGIAPLVLSGVQLQSPRVSSTIEGSPRSPVALKTVLDQPVITSNPVNADMIPLAKQMSQVSITTIRSNMSTKSLLSFQDGEGHLFKLTRAESFYGKPLFPGEDQWPEKAQRLHILQQRCAQLRAFQAVLRRTPRGELRLNTAFGMLKKKRDVLLGRAQRLHKFIDARLWQIRMEHGAEFLAARLTVQSQQYAQVFAVVARLEAQFDTMLKKTREQLDGRIRQISGRLSKLQLRVSLAQPGPNITRAFLQFYHPGLLFDSRGCDQEELYPETRDAILKLLRNPYEARKATLPVFHSLLPSLPQKLIPGLCVAFGVAARNPMISGRQWLRASEDILGQNGVFFLTQTQAQ